MIVETHNAMRQPTRCQATQIVVRDRFGQVAALVLEPADGVIQVIARGDPSFDDLCATLGLRDGIRVLRPAVPEPPSLVRRG